MTLYEYYELDYEQQEAILPQATELAERRDLHYRYRLFQMNRFYIEVKESLFYKIKREFYAFEESERLTKYLSEIDLSELPL